MADVSITAANVVTSYTDTALVIVPVLLGTAAMTAGMPVYLDSADGNRAKPARANASTTDDVYGILLHGGGDEQPGWVLRSGDYNPGFTVGVGKIYILSAAAAGGIAPVDDVDTSTYPTVLGIGITSSRLRLSIIRSGVLAAAAVT